MHSSHPALAVALAAALLAGCSASAVSPPPTPTVSRLATPPQAGVVSLRDRGITSGPGDRVWLPAGVTITRTVDQVNVITAIGLGTDASAVLDALRANLPAGGWTVTADKGGSLRFSDPVWDASYTSDVDVWGLTVRKKETPH